MDFSEQFSINTKVTTIVPTLMKKYAKAQSYLLENTEAEMGLTNACKNRNVEEWAAKADAAQKNRERSAESMDYYGVRRSKGKLTHPPVMQH
jgi:hypothetical protein